MAEYPSIYRAKAVKLDGTRLTAYVPQVFGDTTVTIEDYVGGLPTTFPEMGWVSFQSGLADMPVWFGQGQGNGEHTTDTILLSAYWQYSGVPTPPPNSGQIRTNSPLTTMWVHEQDEGGFDRSAGLDLIEEDQLITVRSSDGGTAVLRVTGPPVDSGNYRAFPVTLDSGDTEAKKGTKIQLLITVAAGGGNGGGGGGTVTDVVHVGADAPTDSDIELWWDTDAEVPLDPRYATPGDLTNFITQAGGDTRYVNESEFNTLGDARYYTEAEVRNLLPTAHFSGNGSALVTSGTTQITICTLAIPARPVAGSLVVNSHSRVGKSVVTDIFVFTLLMGASAMAQAQTYSGGAYEWVGLSGTLGIAANTAATLTVVLQRLAGTGTGTTVATYTENNISALYIPTAS